MTRLLVLCLVVVAILATHSGTAAPASRVACWHAGRTVVASTRFRIYTLPERHVLFGVGRQVGRAFYACRRATGHSIRLIISFGGAVHEPLFQTPGPDAIATVHTPSLNGSYFAASSYGIDSHDSLLSVWSLGTGRNTYSAFLDDGFFARDLEVSRHGAIAWIRRGEDRDVVVKRDSEGEGDIGLADALSGCPEECRRILAHHGDVVSWREDGAVRSYRLVGRAR